jgi:hypothetical protein
MPIEEELEDSEFEKLLHEKQHKEMMSSLRLLVQCIEKLESSDAIVTKVIQKQSQEVVSFIDRLSDQKPPNINVNQDKVIKELNNLSATITPVLSELKDLSVKFKESIDVIQNKKPIEWEFTVDRGYNNRIEKIIAKPKNS